MTQTSQDGITLKQWLPLIGLTCCAFVINTSEFLFIVLLTYKLPLAEVERHLAAHREYLDRQYAAGTFLCSGPQNPRTGGVILCRAADRAAVETLTAEDPFRIHGVTDYEIIEFSPVKRLPGFEAFI